MNAPLRLTRRGWIVLVIIPTLIAGALLGYATKDICYVGVEHGNAIGYGSCEILDGMGR